MSSPNPIGYPRVKCAVTFGYFSAAVKCQLNCSQKIPKISTLTFVFEEEKGGCRRLTVPTMSGNYATPPPQSATQETTLGQSNGFVDEDDEEEVEEEEEVVAADPPEFERART